jgi:hypothetical protein
LLIRQTLLIVSFGKALELNEKPTVYLGLKRSITFCWEFGGVWWGFGVGRDGFGVF